MLTPSASCSATSASGACTATIAPPSGRACINRPRADTSRHASVSDNTPATCAATNSPIEWPSRKSGRITPALQQPVERDLEREQGRLRELRPIDPLVVDELLTELRAHPVERFGEDREGTQLSAHPGALRPLTREHHRQPAIDRPNR